MLTNVTNTERQRDQVLEYLKANQFKRVLDVGGGLNIWAAPYVTHAVDIRAIEADNIIPFQGDLNEPETWQPLIDDVQDNGKFDFAICTHVLEDLRNPITILKHLPKIADAGFIAVPNKHWELGKVECTLEADQDAWGVKNNWIGFFHHRWILDVKDEAVWLFPKLEFVSKLKGMEWVKGREVCDELSFWWMEAIPWKIFNDDYLGPNGVYVCENYRKELTV